MDIQVRLGVICRFNHIKDDIHWVKVNSAKEALAKIKDYKSNNAIDNWHFLGGDIKVNKTIVAIVSENGSISKPSSEGNDCYELLPDWKNKISLEELQAEINKHL